MDNTDRAVGTYDMAILTEKIQQNVSFKEAIHCEINLEATTQDNFANVYTLLCNWDNLVYTPWYFLVLLGSKGP